MKKIILTGGGTAGHITPNIALLPRLEQKGYEFVSAEVEMVPATTTAITDEDNQKLMAKLLDALDDDDDVQNTWHNLENEEDLDR